MNKDTMLIVAIVIALIACFYLFNENKKTKADIASFKSLMTKPAYVAPVQAQARPKVKIVEPEPEPESEE